MDKLFERAFDYVSETMGQENGNDFLFVSNVMYKLMDAEPNEELTKDEVLKLTQRIVDAMGCSTVSILTAERVEAVCFLLENGIKAERFYDLEPATPEQTKQLLLNCDIDVFTDLVDFVAVENEVYYAPEGPVLDENAERQVNEAIEATLKGEMGLDQKIKDAEVKADTNKEAKETEPEVKVGRIWDETNERYI